MIGVPCEKGCPTRYMPRSEHARRHLALPHRTCTTCGQVIGARAWFDRHVRTHGPGGCRMTGLVSWRWGHFGPVVVDVWWPGQPGKDRRQRAGLVGREFVDRSKDLWSAFVTVPSVATSERAE